VPYPDLKVKAGDTILFQYDTGHNVRKFQNEKAYDNCEFNGRWLSEVDSVDGPFEYVVSEDPGSTIYVGCSVDDHCGPDGGNQKLAIHVN